MKLKKILLFILIILSSISLFSQKKGIFTDSRDNQKYEWVKIGDQIWMAENLNYTTESGSWCYDGERKNCEEYGRLYYWKAAQNACPDGWHLPSKDEYKKLLNNFGNLFNKHKKAFKSLKAGGSSGFTAKFSNWTFSNGYGHVYNKTSSFWSSERNNISAWFFNVTPHFKKATYFWLGKENGISIRCIKD